MITKERLNELIKKNKTVYYPFGSKTRILPLDPENCKVYDGLMLRQSLSNTYTYYLDQLFEDKKEAERYSRYGRITRTDTISLPTFEVASKNRGVLVRFSTTKALYDFGISLDEPGSIYLNKFYRNNGEKFEVFRLEATEEEYLVACETVRNTFTGGWGEE